MGRGSSKQVTSQLDCPNCCSPFTRPTAFKCNHFICQSCINGLALTTEASMTGYKCPVCSGITENGTLTPLNYVSDLLEGFEQAKTEQSVCSRCIQEKPAYRCADCKKNFCLNCKQSHDEYFMNTHAWTNLSVNSSPVIDRVPSCDVHKEEFVHFHCKECRKLICQLCNGTDHKMHQAETIDEALKQALPDAKQLRNEVEKQIAVNETKLSTMKTQADHLKKEYEHLEKNIDTVCNEVINKVHQDTKKVKEKLSSIKVMHISNMEETLKNAERRIQSQRNVVTLYDATVNASKGAYLLQILQCGVHEYLTQYTTERLPEQKCLERIHASFDQSELDHINLVGTVSEIDDMKREMPGIDDSNPVYRMPHRD